MSPKARRRLNLELSEESMGRLVRLKGETGLPSKTAVIVRALEVYRQVVDAHGEVEIRQGETVRKIKFIL